MVEIATYVEGHFANAKRTALVVRATAKTLWVAYWVPSNERFQVQKVSVKRVTPTIGADARLRGLALADAEELVLESLRATERGRLAKAQREAEGCRERAAFIERVAGMTFEVQALVDWENDYEQGNPEKNDPRGLAERIRERLKGFIRTDGLDVIEVGEPVDQITRFGPYKGRPGRDSIRQGRAIQVGADVTAYVTRKRADADVADAKAARIQKKLDAI